MARTTQKRPDELNHHWYFAEWLDAVGMKQSDVIRQLDWSKGKTSPLFNDEATYTQQHIDEVAGMLGVEPWALLMPPDTARYVAQTFRLAGIKPPRKRLGTKTKKARAKKAA